MVRQAHHERVLWDFERRSEDFEKALEPHAYPLCHCCRNQLNQCNLTIPIRGQLPMKRSEARILTTHTGSLPRPEGAGGDAGRGVAGRAGR